jgi:hypothetical protein
VSAGVRMGANDDEIHTVLVEFPKLDVRSLTRLCRLRCRSP